MKIKGIEDSLSLLSRHGCSTVTWRSLQVKRDKTLKLDRVYASLLKEERRPNRSSLAAELPDLGSALCADDDRPDDNREADWAGEKMLIGGPEPSLFRGVCGDVLCAERERTGASLSLVISDGGWVGEKKLTEGTEPIHPLIGGGRGGGRGGFIRVGSSDQLIRCLSRLWVDSEAAGICIVPADNVAGTMQLFMDDTAVLATSRDGLNEKLALLIQAAKDIDMEIHPEKSKFMTINSNDKSPFYFDHITIGHVNKYVYLGSEIADASLHDQVKANVDMKRSHLIKFGSFLRKNSEAPFSVKKLVLDSALTSAVLYGCESWLCNNLQAAVSPILSAQKQLLAVRSQTCNDLVQIELAQPDGKTVIQETQLSFLRKLTNRSDFVGSPAHLALRLSRRASTAASSYVDKLLKETPGSLRDQNLRIVQEKISESQSSRRRAYADLNGSFTYHPVYTSNVPEKARMAFTKLRLGSHRLKIETGRWSRIPRDERLCHCLEVQTETHVLLSCPLTESLRRSYSMLNFDNIISLMESSPNDLALYCQDVLGLYEVD